MRLRHEPDVSVADWIVGADEDWWVLATQGPPGFDAYATVHLDDERSRGADPELVALATQIAASHTTTPQRAWFALWDGWGQVSGGGRVYEQMDPHRLLGRLFRAPRPVETTPAFPPQVMDSPRVHLQDRQSYLLFTGAVEDVGDWGARPPRPDWPADIPQAAFTWPEDRAWCIASDVDPDWCTVGGSRALVDAVLAHPDLRAEPATYGVLPPD